MVLNFIIARLKLFPVRKDSPAKRTSVTFLLESPPLVFEEPRFLCARKVDHSVGSYRCHRTRSFIKKRISTLRATITMTKNFEQSPWSAGLPLPASNRLLLSPTHTNTNDYVVHALEQAIEIASDIQVMLEEMDGFEPAPSERKTGPSKQ